MIKREAALKSALFKQLKKDDPTILVFQLATAGAPDREVISNGYTSYWECKHGTPGFTSLGNQKLICQRIENQGFHCRYILWIDEPNGSKYTLIVEPNNIDDYSKKYESLFGGHDHKAVSEYIRSGHKNGYFD